MIKYIETDYVCVNCRVGLVYEDYGEIKSTMLYCPECKKTPALTKDGKKTDTSKLTIHI